MRRPISAAASTSTLGKQRLAGLDKKITPAQRTE
jgi:hypothetical protein